MICHFPNMFKPAFAFLAKWHHWMCLEYSTLDQARMKCMKAQSMFGSTYVRIFIETTDNDGNIELVYKM